jgi:hypothetical protein
MNQVMKLNNIPLWNLLHEFFVWKSQIRAAEFQQQFAVGYRKPISTPLLIWGGDPSDLLTLILQRAILGLESYVSASVWFELGKAGRLTPELSTQARNPFSIPTRGRGTAWCYYKALPSLLDPKLSLQTVDAVLWNEVRDFYKNIRNKILHGSQIESHDPTVLHPPFDMIANVYKWVDTWHKLEVRDDRPLKVRIVLSPGKNRGSSTSR